MLSAVYTDSVLLSAVYTDSVLLSAVYTDSVLLSAVYTDSVLLSAVYTDSVVLREPSSRNPLIDEAVLRESFMLIRIIDLTACSFALHHAFYMCMRRFCVLNTPNSQRIGIGWLDLHRN